MATRAKRTRGKVMRRSTVALVVGLALALLSGAGAVLAFSYEAALPAGGRLIVHCLPAPTAAATPAVSTLDATTAVIACGGLAPADPSYPSLAPPGIPVGTLAYDTMLSPQDSVLVGCAGPKLTVTSIDAVTLLAACATLAPPGAVTPSPTAKATRTVTPKATRTPTPARTSTPKAGATPRPGKAATAAPAPPLAPPPSPAPVFTTARLGLDAAASRCIPAAGQQACDDTRRGLWNGDPAAWTAEQATRGQPAPGRDDLFLLAYGFRLNAGDPAALASVAQGMGWPRIEITALRFRGLAPDTQDTTDEYVEVRNTGGAAQDMTGWRLHAVESGANFVFAGGFMLEPGASCRFSTGDPRPDACDGTLDLTGAARWSVATRGVWDDAAGTAELWYDPLALLAATTRYSADPAAQPPPPNLCVCE